MKKILLIVILSSSIVACQKEKDDMPQIILGDTVQSMNILFNNAYVMVNNSSKIEVFNTDNLENGYFVTNEGNFGSGNGSLSFIDISNNNTEFDITDRYVKTISVSSPRYMAKVSNNKAYITDWGINGVQVLDLNTNSIVSTISCGIGPEGITSSNGFAYVCNVGGWGLDNTVTVIDISKDEVETTLTVGDKPNSAVVDINGAIWVLTRGNTEYDANWNVVSETAGNLVKIVDNTIEATYEFPVGNHPEDLVIDDSGTTLYYSDGSWSKAVYAFNVNDTELSTTALINRSFYSLGFDNGYIYGTDAVDYIQAGWSYRFSASGNIIDSVQVGIIPGGYCFN